MTSHHLFNVFIYVYVQYYSLSKRYIQIKHALPTNILYQYSLHNNLPSNVI